MEIGLTEAVRKMAHAAADWKHIDEVAIRLVEDAVGSAGLDAGRYLELAGEARLSKIHGRRALGCMNDLSHMLDPARIDMGEKLQWRGWCFSTATSYPSAPATRTPSSPPNASPRTCGRWPNARSSDLTFVCV